MKQVIISQTHVAYNICFCTRMSTCVCVHVSKTRERVCTCSTLAAVNSVSMASDVSPFTLVILAVAVTHNLYNYCKHENNKQSESHKGECKLSEKRRRKTQGFIFNNAISFSVFVTVTVSETQINDSTKQMCTTFEKNCLLLAH